MRRLVGDGGALRDGDGKHEAAVDREHEARSENRMSKEGAACESS